MRDGTRCVFLVQAPPIKAAPNRVEVDIHAMPVPAAMPVASRFNDTVREAGMQNVSHPWLSSSPLPLFTRPIAEMASTAETITETDIVSPANSHPSSTATSGFT
jgi:hypothetical protein